ncbi:MAG: adenylyltransferase/cytidyltransferase family protein [Candidatus Paceibacterota bacterium]|jgi:D-beta-D-heptose 7-phosphate kinase/D-beta-D-heptose 1-phosphate adenosyltransferase
MDRKIKKSKKKKVVMVSGGFDPIHIGHIRYIKEAKKLGDFLVVVLNNDNWLRAKKGKEFMCEKDRKEIIEAIAGVDQVIISSHQKNPKDMSVCKELIKIKPDIFAKGGDRDEKDSQDPKSSLYKENQIHRRLGIQIVFNVGYGGKVRSSSELTKEYSKHLKKHENKGN